MKKANAGVLLGFLIALPLAAEPPATGAKPTESGQPPAAFRDELLSVETDLITKAVPMTTEEAAKFWPVFQKFQHEQKTVIDAQIAALRKYADEYATLTDDQAVAYVSALLERDQSIHDLRVRYLGEFSAILPAGKAARVIHLSRRLGFASQVQLSNEIPLVH